MVYKVVPTPKFEKDLKKIGRSNAVKIIRWIEENLENSEDPREKGKQLKYDFREYWRYRIGDFRLLVEIIDNQLILSLITVAHRREVYNKAQILRKNAEIFQTGAPALGTIVFLEAKGGRKCRLLTS